MNVEANKELAITTWNAWVKGDLKTAFANMSDEITWLVPGNLPNLSGVKKGKTALIEFARNAAKMIQSGFKSEIRRVYGDGDTVIRFCRVYEEVRHFFRTRSQRNESVSLAWHRALHLGRMRVLMATLTLA